MIFNALQIKDFLQITCNICTEGAPGRRISQPDIKHHSPYDNTFHV